VSQVAVGFSSNGPRAFGWKGLASPNFAGTTKDISLGCGVPASPNLFGFFGFALCTLYLTLLVLDHELTREPRGPGLRYKVEMKLRRILFDFLQDDLLVCCRNQKIERKESTGRDAQQVYFQNVRGNEGCLRVSRGVAG